ARGARIQDHGPVRLSHDRHRRDAASRPGLARDHRRRDHAPGHAAHHPMSARARPPLPLSPPIAAPSILSADFARLPLDLALVDPTRDWVHCDVMDNHFVPNLTFGPLIVGAVRKLTTAFVDVHLMIDHPERLLAAFGEAGADQITIHLEAPHDRAVARVLEAVRERGARAGLAIKPGTPLAAAEPHLEAIDLILVMTVEPGF